MIAPAAVEKGVITARREASSLRDLMINRDQNKAKIEAVNQTLGTALGWKYSGGIRTKHPAVIVFVPDKVAEGPIPENQRINRDFEAVLDNADTVFCRTDVVRGGKAADEKDPPPLDNQIRAIIAELRMDGSAWSAACSSVA